LTHIFCLKRAAYHKTITLIEQKLRRLQIRGVKGEAVDFYCKPLTTKEMGYHRLSRRVNKMEKKQRFYNSPALKI